MALSIAHARYIYSAGTAFEQHALDGVDLEVDDGGLAVVAGSTGSGKSTLLKLAAGLLRPESGHISVDGRAIASPADARGRVGIVFQRPEAQFFAVTVEEDVAFGPRNLGLDAGEAARAASAALSDVGLDPEVFGPRSPFLLSGGEARRVALAGVLAMRPAYLLLDEPTAGLDARGRRAVREAVRAARARAGVVVVTHDADEFLAEADSLLVLDAGRPVFEGPPADLFYPSAREACGDACPSQVVEAQLLAASRTDLPGSGELDLAAAARRLAAAAGRPA